jgi:hypothetical protein
MSRSPFELRNTHGMPVNPDDLLADMRRVAEQIGTAALTIRDYQRHGRFAPSTAMRQFGSWNAALSAAQLVTSNSLNISDETLFENILVLWQHYGRQPRRSELASHPSTISQSPYNRRFRSWSASLVAFVEYANTLDTPVPTPVTDPARRRTSRDPSLRLRFKILQRDRFTCCQCGASPTVTAGVELHIDHIIPWSLGGETVLENLQTLCLPCNIGKGNAVVPQG